MIFPNRKKITYTVILLLAIITLSFTFKNNEKYLSLSKITPVNVEEKGIDLLDKVQGQWLGINSVAGINYNWFAWDYRAISKSHIHGIYEGGTMGNLFTSFFVADFKGTKTIMARNGGVLNGIYRTSYFVLDSVRNNKNDNYYRLVDGVGGKNTMYMELRFKNDSLYWNSYTSKLGSNPRATRHMTYKGKKFSDSLAKKTAQEFQFPQKEAAYVFLNGFDDKFLYMKKSASFLWQSETDDVATMAKKSLDPISIDDYPFLGKLKLKINQPKEALGKQLAVFVSTKPLVNKEGKLVENTENINTSILYSYLNNNEKEFEYTYVHPSNYYVTVVADLNGDYIISKGDLMSKSIPVSVGDKENAEVSIDDISFVADRYFFVNFGNDFYKKDKEKEEKEEVPVIDWEVTYNSDVKKIIFNNCITCHSGKRPSSDLDLTTFRNVKRAIKKHDLIKRMNDREKPMPPTDLLSLKDRLIVFKWKKDGLIEN